MKLLSNFIRLVPVLLLCALGCAAALIGLRRLDRWCQRSLQTATTENNLSAPVASAARTLPTDISQGVNPLGSDVSAPGCQAEVRPPEGNGTATHSIATSGEIRTGQFFVGDEVTRL